MNIRKSLVAAACLAALSGCSQQDTDVDTATNNALGQASIGTINGQNVPESVFRRLGLNLIQKTAEDMTPEERAQVIDQLVTLKLVANAGEAANLDQERNVAAELELQRLQQLANFTIERYLEENPPSEAELRDLYEERTQNLSGTEYKARHILLDTEEEAREVIALLDAGGDFAELAAEYSTGPTGPSGGDLGWFTPDRMVEPFSNAVVAMEPGTFSADPVQTQFGWHVILVEESRPQQAPGIESMRQELITLARRQKIADYIQSLRDTAIVEVE